MAQRRMFSRQVVNTDGFLDMPLSAQALYFHLGLEADDDGFLNNAKSIKRYIGASDDDLKLLVAKKYIIPFNDGVIVIRHWNLNNQIRKDRYTPTLFQDDFQQLEEKNQVYNLPIPSNLATNGKPNDNQMTTNGKPSGNQMTTNGKPNKPNFSQKNNSKELASLEGQAVKRYDNQMATNGIPSDNQMATQCSVGKSSSVQVRLGKRHTDEQARQQGTSYNQKDVHFQIIDYLNRRYSLRLNPTLLPTKKIIDARLNDGYSLDDFKEVIDNIDNLDGINNWKNEEGKKQALRPKLLFTKDNFNKVLTGKQSEPQDPFMNSSDDKEFNAEQQVSGIIKYINRIYQNDLNKLNLEDKQTRNIIRQAIKDFGTDKKLIEHLKNIHTDYDSIDGLLDDLQSGVPF